MAKYFKDYQWSNRTPVGVKELAAPLAGKGYFKFVDVDNGTCVERYNKQSQFECLCHHPSDHIFKPEWKKERVGDDAAIVLDSSGCVVRHEKYSSLSDSCGDEPLVNADIFSAEGRLLESHEVKKVSENAYDIFVKDGLGKPKGIIHHSDVGSSEPITIKEEWVV